jgi:hypothetical protein
MAARQHQAAKAYDVLAPPVSSRDPTYSEDMDPAAAIGSLASTVRAQVSAAARLPSTTLATVEELRGAARAMRRVADRVDGILD